MPFLGNQVFYQHKNKMVGNVPMNLEMQLFFVEDLPNSVGVAINFIRAVLNLCSIVLNCKKGRVLTHPLGIFASIYQNNSPMIKGMTFNPNRVVFLRIKRNLFHNHKMANEKPLSRMIICVIVDFL